MSESLRPPRRDLFPVLRQSFLRFVGITDTIGRVYSSAGPHPVGWDTFRTYGPTDCRFDHHPDPPKDHPRHGIAYGVPRREDPTYEILVVCLLERFQRTKVVNRWRDQLHFATCRPTRLLCLLNVSSRWATTARCNGAISSGVHDMARRWSRAICLHYRNANAKYIDDAGREWPILLDGLLSAPLLDAPLCDSRFDPLMDELGQVGLRVVVRGISGLPVSPLRVA